VTFRQADANEYFSYIVTRELRFSQSLFARYNRTSDNAEDFEPPMENTITDSAETGLAMSIDRSFEVSSLSLEGGVSVSRLERKAPVTAMMGSRLDRQVTPRLRAAYRRDLDQRFSLGATAASSTCVRFSPTRTTRWTNAAAASSRSPARRPR